MRRLLPNSPALRLKAVESMLGRSDPDCIVDLTPVLRYFDFGRSFEATMVIMAGYFMVLNVLTFWAMLVLARREQR